MKRIGMYVLIGAVVILAGCGGEEQSAPQDGATEVVFWHTQAGKNAAILEKIIEDFNASHPGIHIRANYMGSYGDTFHRMKAAIAGDSTPDLAVAYESMVAEYASEGVVMALDDYVHHPEHGFSPGEFEDIFSGYISTNTFEEFGGTMLSFPFTKSNLMLYYNMDMIRKAGFETRPGTWKQFLAQCRAIRKITGNPAYALSVDASTIDGMIYSFGGNLYVKEGDTRRSLFDAEPSLETFRLIETLTREKLAYQINPGTYEDRDAFSSQRVAFMIRSSTSRPYLTELIQERFDWGLSEIPHKDGRDPVTVMFGANICMFKSTPERQLAAWMFIKHFISPKVTALWATETGYLPVRKSAVNEEPFKTFVNAHPRHRVAFDVIPIARSEPNIAGWQEIRDHIEEMETAVVAKVKTAPQAVEELTKRANSALAR